MNYRDLINKLEAIERGETISEAITIKDVMAAVQGKADQQERAKILNDLAWKENLPGLYDPTDGSFVQRQSAAMPGTQYSIAGTASKDDDAQLAQLGLVPKNAKTSSALGRFFGTSGDMYDKGVQTTSQGIIAQQEKAELIKTSMAKLGELLKKLQDVVAQEAKFNAAVDARVKAQQGQGAKATTPPKPVKESFSKSLVESFGYTAEEQTEEGFGAAAGKLLGRAAPGAGAVLGGLEAAERWKDGDYVGAGLAGLSGAFSLVPGLGWIPAVGLAAVNMGRDAAKASAAEKPAQGAAAAKPTGSDPKVAALQAKLKAAGADLGTTGPKGDGVDGVMGPRTQAAMQKFPNIKESVEMKSAAEQYRDLVSKLELLENPVDTGEEVPPEVAAKATPASSEDQALDAQIEKAGGEYAMVNGEKYIITPKTGADGKPVVVKADTLEIVDGTKPGLPPTGEVLDPSALGESFGLDEGLWDTIFRSAVNLGKNFKGGLKGWSPQGLANKGVGAGRGSQKATQAARTANAAGQKIKGAADFAKANPLKTGFGVGGLGYTAGSLAGGPDSSGQGAKPPKPNASGQSGSGQGAQASQTPATPETPAASPEVQGIVDEIRKLMNDMAKIDDPTVKDAIGKATQQIDAIPGVKKPA